MGDDAELAAWVADRIRATVEAKLNEAWRSGMRDGFAVARHMAQTVRDESARLGSREQVEVLDGLITSLSNDPVDDK